MELVEELVKDLYSYISRNWHTREVDGQLGPVKGDRGSQTKVNDNASGLYPSMPGGPKHPVGG